RDLFVKYNPKVKSELIKPGTSVRLPAGPMWIFNVPKQTSDDLSALDLAKLEMGVAGPKTRQRIAELNNTKSSLVASIRGGQVVTLPYVAPFVSIEIKQQYRATAAKIVRQLATSDPAVQSVEIAPPFRLIGPLASSSTPIGVSGAPIYSRP